MRARAVALAFISIAATMTAGFCFLGPPNQWVTGENDFRQLYSGATLVGTADLYSLDANAAVQRQLGLRVDRGVSYSRPPFYAVLLRPLTNLSYPAAHWSFQVLTVVSFALFIWLFAPELPNPLRIGLTLPVIACILFTQDLFLVVLAAGASLLLARRGWDFLAGVVLAACAIKFHLFIFVPLVMFRHRRWRLIAGGLTAGLGMLALSFLAAGPDWPVQYWHALSNPALHDAPAHMPNIHGLMFRLGLPWQIELVVTLMFSALVVIAVWRVPIETGFSIALIGGLFATYHSYLYDQTLFLLAVPLLMRAVPRFRAVLTHFIGPVPYVFSEISVLRLAVFLFFAAVIAAAAFSGPGIASPRRELEMREASPIHNEV